MKWFSPWRATNLHKDSPIWPHIHPRKSIYFSSKMSLRNNMLFFYFPCYSGFLVSPFCLCPLKILAKQIHHKWWQLRRLALACPCVSAQPWRDHLEASGNNSLSMPIKSLASPWRLQQGCQLMSIVTVVYVAGTPAHEGLSRDPQQRSSVVLRCVNDFTGEEAALTHHKFHSLLTWVGRELQFSQRGGLCSTAQFSCDLSLFPWRADILYFLCKLTRINVSLKAAAYTALQPSRYRPSWCLDRCKLFK